MSKANIRKSAVAADQCDRRIHAALAREHALVALDHLYAAQLNALQARGAIQLVGDASSPNDLVLAMTQEAWKILVHAFMQGGVIKPGDIGRYGIPPEHRQKPAEPGNNGHAVQSPEDTHGEDQGYVKSDQIEVPEAGDGAAGDDEAGQPDAGPQ